MYSYFSKGSRNDLNDFLFRSACSFLGNCDSVMADRVLPLLSQHGRGFCRSSRSTSIC